MINITANSPLVGVLETFAPENAANRQITLTLSTTISAPKFTTFDQRLRCTAGAYTGFIGRLRGLEYLDREALAQDFGGEEADEVEGWSYTVRVDKSDPRWHEQATFLCMEDDLEAVDEGTILLPTIYQHLSPFEQQVLIALLHRPEPTFALWQTVKHHKLTGVVVGFRYQSVEECVHEADECFGWHYYVDCGDGRTEVFYGDALTVVEEAQ